MDNVIKMKSVFGQKRNRERNRERERNLDNNIGNSVESNIESRIETNKSFHPKKQMTLVRAKLNTEYTIKMIITDNREIQDFLFTLGCYEGELITVISMLADHYVIVVKDARYSIDKDLASCIVI